MALVPCRECEHQVSTEASSCPHCGVPYPTPKKGYCVACGREIEAIPSGECPECGVIEPFRHSRYTGQPEPKNKSILTRELSTKDTTAGCLGVLLGPVGLWSKGHWAAGFAWLVMAILGVVASGGLLIPIFLLGMGIHAAVADNKTG